MNGAFVARIHGPTLIQTGYPRPPTHRSIIAHARRVVKTLEEPVEEALAPAADAAPKPPKRTRKARATAVVHEINEVANGEKEGDALAWSRRRETVDEVETTVAMEEFAEDKPKRSNRKKMIEAIIDTDSQPDESKEATAIDTAVSADAAGIPAKPKRAARKKAPSPASDEVESFNVDVTEDGAAAATAAKPKAKRTSRKVEPELPDVVSTRRRKVLGEVDEEVAVPEASHEADVPVVAIATASASKRRATSRRGSSRTTAPTSPSDAESMQSELAKLVIQRNEEGEVVSINRAALGTGRKMWYAVGVSPGMELKWAEQLRQKLSLNDSLLLDPESGELVPVASLIVPWVPVRRDWVISKKTGNTIQRKVVHKEGWVYVNAPLGEEVVRIVEDCYGFQLWRGEQDHFFNDVGSVKLITPLSDAMLEEIRVWEATEPPKQMDADKKEMMEKEMFGEAGGDVLGQSERREDREDATEVDEHGRAVYRNTVYTGGHSNPSNLYQLDSNSESTLTEAAAAADEPVSLDGRGTEMTFAPEPELRRREHRPEQRSSTGSREGRPLHRDRDEGSWDRRQGRGGGRGREREQRLGQAQSGWEERGASQRGWQDGRQTPQWQEGRQTPQWQAKPQPVPTRAGVSDRRSYAAPQPRSPPPFPKADDFALEFEDEADKGGRSPIPTPAAVSSKATVAPSSLPKSGFRVQGGSKSWKQELLDDEINNRDDDFAEEADGVGRIEGPRGGLDMDEWFDSKAAGARGGGTATAGVDLPAGDEFDRLDGDYLSGFEKGGDDLSKFDFDLDGVDSRTGGGWPKRSGGRASSATPRRGGGGESFDDLFGGFDDQSASSSGGGFFGGGFDDLDDELWGSLGSRGSRGGAASRGGGGRGGGGQGSTTPGRKLGNAGLKRVEDDLFGGDDDWGYFEGAEDGYFNDFGGADSFDLDADPWGVGGGGGDRQSRSGRGASTGQGGGGGGYMSGSGPSDGDDLGDPVSAPAPSADRPGQGQGQGYRGGGGGGWKQSSGRGSQQGGSGYGNRGYQNGGDAGYQRTGGGGYYEGGGGGGWGANRRGSDGGRDGYRPQQGRGGGARREGDWQERRDGNPRANPL